jgi:hypothetical protein
MRPTSQSPRLLWVPVRILLVTVLFTLLAFAISLLLGILGTVAWAGLHHVPPDLTLIYRHFAPAIAAAVAVIVLVVAGVLEVRHYRQARALAAIERIS